MNKTANLIHYRKVIAAFVFISLCSMLIIAMAISSSQRRKQLENEEARANSEIALVAAMVTEPMLRYQFDYIEQFVKLWGAGNDRIISLQALSPEGIILVSFERNKSTKHVFPVEKTILFDGHHLLTLQMFIDMTGIEENLADLRKGLYLQSFLVSMAITLLLILTLKVIALRPLEKEMRRRAMAEEELQDANMTLKNKIEEQEKAEQLLARAKEQWERTVDAIPDLIALIDRDHKVVRINKAMASAMGVNSSEAVGQPFCLISPGMAPPGESCQEDVLIDSLEPLSVEMFINRFDGYYEINVMPYHGPNGEIQGTVFIAHDISERKIAEQEKDKLKSDLLHAQKLESVGRLAAGIAHEINTPTQYVSTNIQFMSDAFEDIKKLVGVFVKMLEEVKKEPAWHEVSDEVVACLDDVDWDFLVEEFPLTIKQSQDGLSRVSTIVLAMKEFSHPGGKNKEPVDLNKIIDTTVAIARNEWKYVADVETDLDENLPQVNCLVDEMGQVFLNLLINAAHAIAAKLGENAEIQKGCITIRSSRQDGWVEVRISDTGTGIPEKVRYRVFDPFFTTKEVGAGTGQGLSIAHDVVTKKHGGTLTFETAIGKGTTFIIRLPIAE